MNTGGPAFPVPDSHHANGQVQYGTNGMTLRQWYAGMALQGLCANPELTSAEGKAQSAFQKADDMLREEADHSEDKLGKDHSTNAGKVAKLEASNRELLEALEKFLEAGVGFGTHPVVQHDAVVMARAALAKAKGQA